MIPNKQHIVQPFQSLIEEPVRQMLLRMGRRWCRGEDGIEASATPAVRILAEEHERTVSVPGDVLHDFHLYVLKVGAEAVVVDGPISPPSDSKC